jgi:hypothetical protein
MNSYSIIIYHFYYLLLGLLYLTFVFFVSVLVLVDPTLTIVGPEVYDLIMPLPFFLHDSSTYVTFLSIQIYSYPKL